MNDSDPARLRVPRSQLAPPVPGQDHFEHDAWRSPNGYVIGVDPNDETSYLVRGNGRETLRRRIPTDAVDVADRIKAEIVWAQNFGDHMPDPDGLDSPSFRAWAERAVDDAEAEYERRSEEHRHKVDADGWERGSDIQTRNIDFLIKPYIPIGHPTLLAGDPGVGKSKVSLAIAAGVTRGEYGGLPPRDVLIMSVEDDHESSIAPMLLKLGADMDRVHVLPIDKAFTLDDTEGWDKLDRALESFDPMLVVIDPMTFFLGGRVDMHRANEVRAVMKQVSARAAKYRNVFLPIIHVNKGQGKLLYKILGSIDFSASVRSALVAGMVDDEPERGRVLIHVKTNSGKHGDAIGFDLAEDPNDPDGAPVFEWRETDITRADLEGNAKPGRKPSQSKLAESIVVAMLRDGPMDSKIVKRAVAGAGVSDATLRRVRSKLVEIDSTPLGPAGGTQTMWKLSPLSSQTNVDAETESWLNSLGDSE
jgi:hypothetical protein